MTTLNHHGSPVACCTPTRYCSHRCTGPESARLLYQPEASELVPDMDRALGSPPNLNTVPCPKRSRCPDRAWAHEKVLLAEKVLMFDQVLPPRVKPKVAQLTGGGLTTKHRTLPAELCRNFTISMLSWKKKTGSRWRVWSIIPDEKTGHINCLIAPLIGSLLSVWFSVCNTVLHFNLYNVSTSEVNIPVYSILHINSACATVDKKIDRYNSKAFSFTFISLCSTHAQTHNDDVIVFTALRRLIMTQYHQAFFQNKKCVI